MQEHECTKMLLHPMINFNFDKNYLFTRLNAHKMLKQIQLNPINSKANFWVLQACCRYIQWRQGPLGPRMCQDYASCLARLVAVLLPIIWALRVNGTMILHAPLVFLLLKSQMILTLTTYIQETINTYSR